MRRYLLGLVIGAAVGIVATVGVYERPEPVYPLVAVEPDGTVHDLPAWHRGTGDPLDDAEDVARTTGGPVVVVQGDKFVALIVP